MRMMEVGTLSDRLVRMRDAVRHGGCVLGVHHPDMQRRTDHDRTRG